MAGSTKITVIYENPDDPEAFEAGYPEQLARGRAIPGVQRTESSKVWPKEDGSPTRRTACSTSTSATTTQPPQR